VGAEKVLSFVAPFGEQELTKNYDTIRYDSTAECRV